MVVLRTADLANVLNAYILYAAKSSYVIRAVSHVYGTEYDKKKIFGLVLGRLAVKFIFSKATKIDKIFTLDLMFTT